MTKLDRLKKGKHFKAPGWLDRFKSAQYVVTTLIILIAFGIIIHREILRIGSIQTSSLTYEKAKSVSYPVMESLPLMTTLYFWFDSVIEKINSLEKQKNLESQNLISTTNFDELSENEKLRIEKFMCENTIFNLCLIRNYERIGEPEAHNVTHFPSSCRMIKNWIAFGKIRV